MRQACTVSALLFLIIIPAVVAFLFGVFVLYSILPDVNDRLDSYYGYPDAKRLTIDTGRP